MVTVPGLALAACTSAITYVAVKRLSGQEHAASVMVVPGHPDVQLRHLTQQDLNQEYFQLLGQLTNATQVTFNTCVQRYNQQRASGDYHVLVIVDKSAPEGAQLIGSATLLVERKFIRGCGSVGHIEDVVVAESHRGQKLGQVLLQALTDLAFQMGCYKAILDCSRDKVQFYERCGYQEKGVQMARYF